MKCHLDIPTSCSKVTNIFFFLKGLDSDLWGTPLEPPILKSLFSAQPAVSLFSKLLSYMIILELIPIFSRCNNFLCDYNIRCFTEVSMVRSTARLLSKKSIIGNHLGLKSNKNLRLAVEEAKAFMLIQTHAWLQLIFAGGSKDSRQFHFNPW